MDMQMFSWIYFCHIVLAVWSSTITDFCNPNPCQNGASCEQSSSVNYKCNCTGNYRGRNCDIEIFCHPDNSIDIYSLPSDRYYFAVQAIPGGSYVRCNVTDINANAVSITGCAKDLPILLTYGTYSGIETYSLLGGNLTILKIICNEIPHAGNVHSVSATVDAFNMTGAKIAVKPIYQVTSSLDKTSAIVGSPVVWTINFPIEYILEVTYCNAYPGTDNTSPVSVALVTDGGCNATGELISHFTDNMNGTATATIKAFKFFNNDNIFLTCDAKVCPAWSSFCDTTCSRQKRSAEHIRIDSEPEEEEVSAATVYNVLKVIDASKASSRVSLFSRSMLLTLTFICWDL